MDNQVELYLKKLNKLFKNILDVRAAAINCGHCYHYAYIVYRVCGGALYYDEGHAFIKINGKYYDSESIRGVANWKRLPCEARSWWNSKPKRAKSIREFKRFWGEHGTNRWQENLCEDFIRELREMNNV